MFSKSELVFVFSELIFSSLFFRGLEGCEISFVVIKTFVVLMNDICGYIVEKVATLVLILRGSTGRGRRRGRY
jgi:hypothetical protein